MHAYTYLETCARQYLTFGAVESASTDKSGSTISVFSPSDNNGVDDTAVDDTDGVPEDEELGGAAPASVDPAAAVPDCCSEKFIRLVLLRFNQCAPSRFIRRIHAKLGFVSRDAASALKSSAIALLAAGSVRATEYQVKDYEFAWVTPS
jgi:hypothetical protein